MLTASGIFGWRSSLEADLVWRDLFLTVLIALIAMSFWSPLRRSRRRPVRFDPDRPYQVYTRDFDVEIKADDLEAFLAAPSDPDRGWSERFANVAPRQLYQLEEDLASQRARKSPPLPQINDQFRADDAIVSLLIDHSGSMRGQPLLFAARAALIASELLDRLGARQEVLGFTTVRWKGGESREKWLRDGKPSYPGRLTDLLHIIYCDAGERLSARHCAAMLRNGLLKENIDGEAIQWAASRLRRREESQKYLIVLSDGAPVDDSTLQANGDGYLNHHLRGVIREIELAGDIRLAAIGICHPVEHYYKHSVTIGSPEELEGALVQLIERLLSQSF